MNLEERIARLIDPEAWEPVPPGMGSTTVGIEQQYADQREARKTARRVIDGLRHRYDLSGFIREDA